MAAPFPEVEIERGPVIDQQHAAALGHFLAQARGLEPFEHGHLVLMQALAHGEMAQLMAAQVQTVAVADGHFDALVPGIVRGGSVPVGVQREAVVAGQFRQVRQKTDPVIRKLEFRNNL